MLLTNKEWIIHDNPLEDQQNFDIRMQNYNNFGYLIDRGSKNYRYYSSRLLKMMSFGVSFTYV